MKEKKMHGNKPIPKEEVYSPTRDGIIDVKLVIIESKKYKGGHFGYILEWPTFRSQGKSIDDVFKRIIDNMENAVQNKELNRFEFNYDQSARELLETVYENDVYGMYSYKIKRGNPDEKNIVQNNLRN